jgi:Fibrobacter succinogenes major domain (Fib_succ_major)
MKLLLSQYIASLAKAYTRENNACIHYFVMTLIWFSAAPQIHAQSLQWSHFTNTIDKKYRKMRRNIISVLSQSNSLPIIACVNLNYPMIIKIKYLSILTVALIVQFSSCVRAQCDCSSPPYPPNSVFCSSGPTVVVDVVSPSTGRVWMDRNLGATRAATSSTDVDSYGDYYQWGRRSDGHQCRNSATTPVLSTTDQPSNGLFITNDKGNFDWRNPSNGDLWQGINGVNNPCPSGYRLPTISEFEAERLSWSSNNSGGAFDSPLKLPMAGYRNYVGSSLSSVGSRGHYWTSSVDNSVFVSGAVTFATTSASAIFFTRARGYSVRCIKE